MNSRAKGVAVSTVGYMFVAISLWMMSMTNAGWYGRQYSISMLYPMALILGVIAILAFVANRGLDAVVFFGGATMLGVGATYLAIMDNTHATVPITYGGWFAAMWTIYFISVWASSLKSGVSRSGFLLTLWLALGCAAIGGWTAVTGWFIAAGYLGLISACFAFVAAGSEIVRFGRAVNPNLEVSAGSAARPMAAD